MKERFKKAYEALYRAWENNTLAKNTCTACAVGNIVAAAQGGVITKVHNEMVDSRISFICNTRNNFWDQLFVTSYGEQDIYKNPVLEEELFKLTGYTAYELAKVEYAFETNTKINFNRYNRFTQKEIEEDQFKGLMAVMDVLIELDEVKEGNEYKQNFNKKLEMA
jgi:hypothetical protein